MHIHGHAENGSIN